MIRLTIPCSLLFVTRFRYYLYFCVPLTLIPHQLIIIMTETNFLDAIENCKDSVLPRDYSTQLQFTRDFFLLLCVSAGLYSHSSALTSNFILHQRSTKQEKQLTYLFHE